MDDTTQDPALGGDPFRQLAGEAGQGRIYLGNLVSALAEHSTDAIYCKDLEGRYLLFNRVAGEMVGRPADAVLGCDDRVLFPAPQAEAIREQDRRLLSENQVRIHEERLDTAHGLRHFLTVKGPLRDEAGAVVGSFGISRDLTVLEQTRQALRTSNERFRVVLDNATEAVLLADPEGRIHYANQQAVRLFGYDPSSLAFLTIADVLLQGTAVERRAGFDELRASGRLRLETELEARGGGTVPVELNAVLMPDGDYYLACRDITHRKRAAQALEASERRFRALIEKTSELISVMDANGTVIDKIANANGVMGYSAEELLGRNAFELVHPDDLPQVLELFQHLLVRPGGVAEAEVRVLAKDGSWHWLHTVGSNLLDDPAVGGVVLNSRDVTERRLAELALAEARQAAERQAGELTSLLQAVPAAVWIAHDAECRHISGNRTANQWLRLPEGAEASVTAPEGQRPSHFKVRRNGRELPGDALPVQLAARGIEIRGFEAEIVHEDGSVLPYYGNAVPLWDAQGRPRGAVAAFVDITEIKEAEAALHEAARRKDEFLAMLAHELRNPLTPIGLAAQALERPGLDAAELHWASTTICERVDHMRRLVDELLDASRVVHGRIELRRERLAFAELVAAAAESVHPMIKSKRQRFVTRMPALPVHLDADRVRLTQVLVNLLDNAAKYTPEGGRIEFAARVREGELEVVVSDDGIGIAADLLPHIFELFRQGERSLDRSEGGLGIGLNLAERLVAKHGGRIRADSAGPGRGATFTVRLPILAAAPEAPADDAAAGSGAAEAAAPASAGMRVLVVDDDRLIAYALSKLLDLHGHTVATVASGEEALELAPEFRPQVVLLDIGLAGMDGYETARRLRALPDGAACRLIAVSGYSDGDTRTRVRAAGFDAHLVKPVDYRHIAAALVGDDGP